MSIAAATIGPHGLGQSTLELLADPRKLDKTLASLKDAQERAQTAIDLAGPATEIVAIRAEIEASKVEAEEAKGQALLEAEAITEEAKTQAQLIVDKGTQEAGRITQVAADEAEEIKKLISIRESAIAAVERKLEQRGAEVQRADDGLVERVKALDDREAALDTRDVEIEKLNDSLLKEKTRLADAREHLNAALG